MADRYIEKVAAPQTAWELILLIIKKMPGQLLRTLPMTLLMGILGWIFNFWLMAYVNDGFNPGTWLSKNLIPVTGQMISATVLWGIIGAMIPMVIHFIKSGGKVGEAIGGFFTQPKSIIAGIKTGSTRFNAILCFALAGTLLVENLLSGVATLIAGTLLMNSVVALLSGRGSVMVQLLRMIATDVNVFILKKPGLRMAAPEVGVIVGACGISLVIIGLTRSVISLDSVQIVLNAVWLVFFILGLVLFFSGKPVSRQMVFIILFSGSWLVLEQLGLGAVLADDGGRKEIGGTFIDYISGQGALEVMLRCLPPAIAIMIGAIIGGIISSLSGVLGNLIPDSDGTVVPGGVAEDGWDTATESDDYETRLRKYINSLDPSDAKKMVDPLTGTEYLVKYDPVTGESFELISKQPFSMDKFREAQKSAEGRDDYRERNDQLEKEYQQQQRQEEATRRDQEDKLDKLNRLKEKMLKAAEKMDDYEERTEMYKRLDSIRKMQNKFLKGEGDLKLSNVAKMYANAINGRTIGAGQMPEDYTLGQQLIDTIKMEAEDYARGDGIVVGIVQTAVVVGVATVCLPAAVAIEVGFILTKAGYGMSDYVDDGGDSAGEAFLIAATTAVKDEVWGWGFGAALKGGKAAREGLKAGKGLKGSAKEFAKAGGDDLLNTMVKTPGGRVLTNPNPLKAEALKKELADARTNFKKSVNKQKSLESDLTKAKKNLEQYQKQVNRNDRITKESNVEVNQREAARNQYEKRIKETEKAAEVAQEKAEALKGSDPEKAAEYQAKAEQHSKNAKSLKNQQQINEDLKRTAKDRVAATKKAQEQAKDNLNRETNVAKEAESNLSNAKNEVQDARTKMNDALKEDLIEKATESEFLEGAGKEVAKNTFEETETSKNIDRWRRAQIKKLIQ
ncbi:hypothetical protein [Acetobacterium sp.]|uniref:hypothetical protein n=1 Tax=Acetobacterium sp. TaxID=1872094 RepID=UPI003594167F